MRIVTEEIKIYKFGENSEVNEKIKEYFRNCYDYGQWVISERVETLKVIAKLLDAKLDYSISVVPARGEFIKFIPKYETLDFDSLWNAVNVDKDCPLTGVCYDHDFIDHLSKYNMNEDRIQEIADMYLESIHEEYEYMLSDEYLKDHCEANGYEFTENGELY